MNSMFANCSVFNNGDAGNTSLASLVWDTSSLTNTSKLKYIAILKYQYMSLLTEIFADILANPAGPVGVRGPTGATGPTGPTGPAVTVIENDSVYLGVSGGIEPLVQGTQNVLIGAGNSLSVKAATGLIAIGYQAGSSVQAAAINNTFVGTQAGLLNTTAVANTFVGFNSGMSTTTGGFNTCLGLSTLSASSTAFRNIAIGAESMAAAVLCNNCVSIGALTNFNVSGDNNVAVGNDVFSDTVTGSNNTGVGHAVGLALNGGEQNTLVGSGCGGSLQTGTQNLVLGYQAGANVVNGNQNVVVGGQIGADVSNCIALGVGSIGPFTQNSQLGFANLTLTTGGTVPAVASSYLPVWIGVTQFLLPLFPVV